MSLFRSSQLSAIPADNVETSLLSPESAADKLAFKSWTSEVNAKTPSFNGYAILYSTGVPPCAD